MADERGRLEEQLDDRRRDERRYYRENQTYRNEGRNYRQELLERFADMDFEDHHEYSDRQRYLE